MIEFALIINSLLATYKTFYYDTAALVSNYIHITTLSKTKIN
jgi:hypothetical protein